MNADQVRALGRATVSGSLPFPEVIGGLLAQGVEFYHVDYIMQQMRFYSAEGGVVLVPLSFEDLPSSGESFDGEALRAAILDSQRHGQKFRDFSRRAIEAGVVGYLVYLHGQRVTYLGRHGDQHVEWFPGARRDDG